MIDLTNDDHALVFVKNVISSGQNILGPWRARAELNLAWVSGQQSMAVGINGTLEKDPYYNDKPNVFTNWMRKYVINSIIRVTHRPFEWQVTPRTEQEADLESARAINRLLPYWWAKLMPNSELFAAVWTYFATGLIFAAPSWDSEAGGPVKIGLEDIGEIPNETNGLNGEKLTMMVQPGQLEKAGVSPQDIMGRFAEHIGAAPNKIQADEDGTVTTGEGDLKLEWLDGFEVTEDMTATRWVDAEYAQIDQLTPFHRLVDIHGEDALKEIQPGATDNEQINQLSPRQRDLTNEQGASDDTSDLVWRHRLYVRPSKRNPKGRYVEVIQERIITNTENPTPDHDIPLIPISASPDKSMIRPRGVIDDLMILQAAINKIDAQVFSHIDKTVDPDYLIPQGSVDDVDNFLSMPDGPNNYEYRVIDGQKPEPKKVEQLAPHIIFKRSELVEEFKFLAGLSDPSVGRPTPDAKSGRAILALGERDDRSNRMAVDLFLEGISDAGHHLIALWANNNAMEQTLLMLGEDDELEFLTLKGETLWAQQDNQGRPGIRKFDIAVELEPPRTREEIIAEVTQYLELGLLNPERDALRIMRAIDAKTTKDLYTPQIKHRMNAARENAIFVESGKTAPEMTLEQTMTNPEMVPQQPVRPDDDDMAHLEVHTKFEMSDRWPELGVVTQESLKAHMMAHKNRMAEKSLEPQLIVEAANIRMRQAFRLPVIQEEEAQQGRKPSAQGVAA